MVLRLFGRDLAVVDEELDEGVVMRDLRENAVAQEVGPRIPDVDHSELVAGTQERDARRAHSAELRVRFGAVDEVCVRLVDGRAQKRNEVVCAVDVVVERGKMPHGDGRGDVPGGGSAHPVGEDKEIGRGVSGVLVVGSNQADVGERGESKLNTH